MTQKQKTLTMLGSLAVVAAGLGAYTWIAIYKPQVADEEKKQAGDVLFPKDKAEFKKLVITAKGESTTVERDGKDEWKVTAPLQAKGERMLIDGIVNKLAGAKRKRAVTDVKDLHEFGLDKPKIKVAVTFESGKTTEILIGDDNAYDGTFFAKTSDSPDVDVCEAGVKYPLDKTLYDLRDKHVFDFDDADLNRMDVVSPKLTYSLVRSSSTEWKVVVPVDGKADAAKGQQIANAVKNLRASRFVTERASEGDLKRYGLDHPAYTVNVTLGKSSAQKTLTIATVKEGGTEHAYVKSASEPFIAEVAATAVKDLDVSVMDLRDKTILSFKEQDATGLAFEIASAKFGVDRHRNKTDAGFGQDDWTLSAPASGPAKRWKCASILSSLETLKGATIASENATAKEVETDGLDKPVKTIRVLGLAGATIAELRIGKTDGAKVYAKAADSPKIYEIESFRLSQLPANQGDLVETPIPNPPGPTAKR